LKTLSEESNIKPVLEVLVSMASVNSKLEFQKLYFERILPEYTLNADLWALYL